MPKSMVISVKRVIFFNKDTRYAVFTAEILKKNRSGGYAASKKIETFVGRIFSIHPKDRLSITAKQTESVLHGRQWQVCTYHREMPGTLEEIKLFLSNIKGLGPAKIKKILDRYGLDVLSEVRSNPKALDGFGMSDDQMKMVREEIVEGECFEDILTFLQLNGLDFRYAFPIFKKYELLSVQKMRDNPYSLYYDRIIDFQMADKLGHALHKDADSKARIEASIAAFLVDDSDSNGNLFFPYAELSSSLAAFLTAQKSGYRKNSFTKDQLWSAVEALVSARRITLETFPGTQELNIYLSESYWAETQIGKRLKELDAESKRFAYQSADIDHFLSNYKNIGGITLADKQAEAVKMALNSHVSILTGGPGTGKTQTLNAIITAIRTLSPKATIKLCAPTGKAALRMSELTGMPAATIHRTLHMGGHYPPLQAGELECDFLLIDEYSMVDCYLCARLFQAAADFTRIIIVGDHEQLPSVGPGLVLRDLIDSGKIPVTHLTTIFRQGKQSLIVKNAAEMIRPHGPDEGYHLARSQQPNGEFYFFPQKKASNIQKAVCSAVKRLMDVRGFKMEEIKVLTPLHGTDLGTDALNYLLQDTFNPNGEKYDREDGLEIRVGDPVVHTHNNYDLNVFNGESGIVKALGYDPDKALLVEFPGMRRVWYDVSSVNELDLAYATTIHKAQGNEFKAVVIPVHETLMAGLNRSSLYTALTRAKQMAIFIGTPTAMSAGLRRNNEAGRNSNLAARLKTA